MKYCIEENMPFFWLFGAIFTFDDTVKKVKYESICIEEGFNIPRISKDRSLYNVKCPLTLK